MHRPLHRLLESRAWRAVEPFLKEPPPATEWELRLHRINLERLDVVKGPWRYSLPMEVIKKAGIPTPVEER